MTNTEMKKNAKREIDYSLINEGPMFVPPHLKKPEFEYLFVGNLPGQIEKYQAWGYEIVVDEEMTVGKELPSRPSQFGAAHTVQSKCGQTMVLMAIPKELHSKLMKYRASKVEEVTRGIRRIDGISDKHQVGEIKFGK